MALVRPPASFSLPTRRAPNPLRASSHAFSSSSRSPSPPPPTPQPIQATPTPIPSTKCSNTPSAPSLFSHTTSNPPINPPSSGVKTRRRMYLSRHPSYCLAPDLELSHPLLYDRLVRRYQSAEERENEGKKRGYARVLEAGLWRGEAVRGMGGYNEDYARIGRGIIGDSDRDNGVQLDTTSEGIENVILSNTQTNGERLDRARRDNGRREDAGHLMSNSNEYIPINKEDGMRRWREEMEARFLRGEDEDFPYEKVDENEDFDDRDAEEQAKEEEWFAKEEAEWMEDVTGEGGGKRTGETGLQDF